MSEQRRDLAALRIPGGWRVAFNNLVEIESAAELTARERDRYLSDDLLSRENAREKLFLDVGWHPAGDPSGTYRLAVVRGTWDDVPGRLEHADLSVIQDALDMVMDFVDRRLDLDTVQAVLDAYAE